MTYEALPCSCGIIHKSGDNTYERFDLLLGHIYDEPIYKNTTRCKVCKEATISKRVVECDDIKISINMKRDT